MVATVNDGSRALIVATVESWIMGPPVELPFSLKMGANTKNGLIASVSFIHLQTLGEDLMHHP